MKSLVSVNWLKEHMEDTNLVLLEVGIGEEKTVPRIKGSKYVNLKENFCDLDNPLPNSLPQVANFEKGAQNLGVHQKSVVIVYDRDGVYFSPRLWWLFKVMGHDQVAVLNGGLKEWQKAAYPLELGKIADNKKGNFKAKFQKRLFRNYTEVAKNVTLQKELLIDARSRGRFNGLEEEPRKGLRSGSIPNSENLPYTEVLEEGKFKSTDDLKNIFEPFEAASDSYIFSCGSGVTACILFLAAAMVSNKQMSVFDGSWTEWVTKENSTAE